MSTVKYLFVTSLLMSVCSLRGQSLINPEIQSKLNDYIEYSNDKNWDKAFDLLYPKLFTRVPKQDLIDLMTGMESDGMSLRMENARITSTSTPVVEGDETFVRVEYEADVMVTIEQEGIYDAPKAIQAMEEQFQHTYGKNQVKWNAGQREFEIRARKAIMAIDSKTEGWRILEINMDQPDLMTYLFSPSIMDALVRVE